MTPALVLFDCDGVLVDTEPATNTALSQNFARHGLRISPDHCLQLFTGGTMKSAGEEARRRGANLPEDWLDEIYVEIFATLARGVAVIDGVVDVLDRLDAAKIPCCVVSNGPERKMEISLGPSGLHDRLAGRIYSAHRYKAPKPDPGMLLTAAADFGVAPEDCVMIDDNAVGVIAAQRAGMRAIGFDALDDPDRLRRHGAEVIGHMSELPPLLGL